MGYDVVGEIDQLGDDVSGFQIGDRVADLTVAGSNAAYRTLRAKDLARVPTGVDAAEAPALILSCTTAYQLIVVHAVSWLPGQGAERPLVGDFGDDWRCGNHCLVPISNSRGGLIAMPCFRFDRRTLVRRMPAKRPKDFAQRLIYP
jgi:hypothetical protein